MKQSLLLLFALFLSNCNKHLKPEGFFEIECGWFGKKTIEERRAIFPFNTVAKVVLISFENSVDVNPIKYQRNIVESTTPWGEPLPHINKTKKTIILDTFKIFGRFYLANEVITLNQQQIDSLSHLVLNYKFNKVLKNGYSTVKGCYTPRNAILFFDKNNTPILDFEICFECGHIYLFPTGEHFHSDNVQCFDTQLYRSFFKQCNIHYGVDSLKN